MGLVLTATVGLIVWIVLWALGAKGFDAFMIATVIILIGAHAEDPRRLPAGSPQLSARCVGRWLRPRRARRRLPALAGCGSVVSASETTGNQLTVYSALPLEGPSAHDRARRSKAARSSRSRRPAAASGAFRVSYASLDDVNPVNGADQPRRKRGRRQAGRAGHLDDRLHRRLQLGSDGRLPAADQRGGHPAGEPRQPVRGPDLLRTTPARTSRNASTRAASARSCGCSPGDQVQAGGAGAADARAQACTASTCSTTRTRSSCRSRRWWASRRPAPASRSPAMTASRSRRDRTSPGEIAKIAASHAQAVFLAGGAGPGHGRAAGSACTAPTRSLLLLGSSSLATSEFTSAIGAAAGSHLPHHAAARHERVPALGAARARRLPPPLPRRSRARRRSTATRR